MVPMMGVRAWACCWKYAPPWRLDSTLDVGVDIVFFDAEDYGTPEWGEKNQNSALTWCLGSQYWANQPHRIGYNAKYGILLDMVGAKGAVFNKEGTSMAYAPAVVKRLWESAERLGYGDYFKRDVTPETIDDNLFVSEFAGIPSANIVHYRASAADGLWPLPPHPCR